ncbi:hypothetical protein K1T71_011829 [Dendrolimus kikuchii]|uniref:Uncharacterized protein n=1 Tax=Dendrolimus kikuchii TaxID=765133 RepID=A0ACC1CMG3_9NEOP|nr:hypothetical protein K1T71_011829 [Dendrolimus kikuchii]
MNITNAEKVYQLRATIVNVDNSTDGSLMDMVVTTVGILVGMALLSCICCFCMKISDLRLKAYIMDKARKKGFKLDLKNMDSKHGCHSPSTTENCTIMVPDVGYIL